jgi:hypothetical protein
MLMSFTCGEKRLAALRRVIEIIMLIEAIHAVGRECLMDCSFIICQGLNHEKGSQSTGKAKFG